MADEQQGKKFGCLGVIALLVVIGAGMNLLGLTDDDESGGSSSNSSAEETDTSGGEGMARVMCEKFVKERLKSPSSADFSETTSSGAEPEYVVSGAVDSENELGAAIRNEYRCLVRYTGNDRWELTELNGLEN